MKKFNLSTVIDKNDSKEWDAILSQFDQSTIFQSYAWGELKKDENWECFRLIISENEKPTLIAQILVKKFLGIKLGWCPGGPILNTKSIDLAKTALNEFKKIIIRKKIFNLRCKPYLQKTDTNLEIFSTLAKSTIKITSSKTVNISTQDDKVFLQDCRKKHRYYIKQSQKHNLEWKISTLENAQKTFIQILNEMQEKKKIKIKLIDIKNFSQLLGETHSGKPRVFALTGYEKNCPIVSCIMSVFDNVAFQHYAASNQRGRKIFASYGMTYELIKVLKDMGVKYMNFGSISDDESSPGVDFFKLGFGGNLFERVGEFDIAKFRIYSFIFNAMLKFRT